MKFKLGVLPALVLLSLSCASVSEERVGYPAGYRNWVHVKSAVITESHPLEINSKLILPVPANKSKTLVSEYSK